ncbi:MAG: hypothetical protein Q9214_001523, partial [Letrouitia sp. 1 TL-2023]
MPARLSSMELSDPVIADTGSSATDAPNRRKSGRITHKPVLLQADLNTSLSTEGSGKRKRSSYIQTAEIADDQSDESSIADSDGDPDEEELKERRRKPRSRKSSSKPAVKKAKIGNAQTTTLPVRPAVNGVKKTPRPRKPKSHPTALVAGSGTGLFSEIFSGAHNIEGVVAEWITRYDQNNTNAMCDLINFVIRCTGCGLQVNVHDIEDPDHATSKLEELQDAYHAQRIIDYPLISRGKGFTSFRATMVGFFDSLIQTCHSAGIFYSDETLIDNLEYWVTAMTSSPIRPFRHTATVICLAIESALCVVATEVANTAANTMRQKGGEEKKKSVNKERVNALKAKVNEQERRQEVVKRYLEDIFNAVYLNRYRDVDPKIRVDCVAALGNWIATHPEHFFSGSYLRYMGWVMSDPSAPTRAEVIKQLTRLYKNKDVGRLRAFTERFRPRMIEMAVRDAEPGIRASTVELLDLIRETGLLEPDDIDTIGRLIFDNEPKVRNAVSGFFAENINDLLETVIEEVGGEEGLAEAIGEDPEDDYDLPRRSWLKFKCLAEVLQSYNSEDDEDLDGATREVNGNLVATGAESRFSLASQVVYQGVEEVKEWEALAGYLLYDFSSAPQTQAAKRKRQSMNSSERIFRERCQLNEKEEMMLLEVLNVAVKQRLTEAIEGEADKKGKRSKSRVDESRATQENITLHLAQVLPNLLKKFGANPANASAVLRLEHILNLEIFQELRQDSTTYASLLNDINKQFLTHADQNVLTEASNALLHARSFEDLEEVTEGKVQELWADTINSLRSLVSVKEKGRTIKFSSLCNTLRRISNLASISDCVAVFDAKERSTSKHNTPAMTAPPLHIITDLISDDIFSEDEQDTGDLDEVVANAIKAVLFYYMWLVRSLKLSLINKTARASAALPDYSAFAESLTSIMNARSGPDTRTNPLRLTAASAYLDLHTLFASLRPASSDSKSRPNDAIATTAAVGQVDDNAISSLAANIPASTQALLLSIFVATEKHYARLSHRVLDRPDPNDPVDDAPMDFFSSDSDDDDEDDGVGNDAVASDERRRTAVLKAEKALCEIAGKMVLGVLAGVFADGGGK